MEAFVAGERARHHNAVTEQIERAIVPPKTGDSNIYSVSKADFHCAKDSTLGVAPSRRLEKLLLPELTALAARQLIEEQQ